MFVLWSFVFCWKRFGLVSLLCVIITDGRSWLAVGGHMVPPIFLQLPLWLFFLPSFPLLTSMWVEVSCTCQLSFFRLYRTVVNGRGFQQMFSVVLNGFSVGELSLMLVLVVVSCPDDPSNVCHIWFVDSASLCRRRRRLVCVCWRSLCAFWFLLGLPCCLPKCRFWRFLLAVIWPRVFSIFLSNQLLMLFLSAMVGKTNGDQGEGVFEKTGCFLVCCWLDDGDECLSALLACCVQWHMYKYK